MNKFSLIIACTVLFGGSCKKSLPTKIVEPTSHDEITFYNNIPQSTTHTDRALCLNHSRRIFYYWTTNDCEVDNLEYAAKGRFMITSDKVVLFTDFGSITMTISDSNTLVHQDYLESTLATKNGWLLHLSESANMENPFRR